MYLTITAAADSVSWSSSPYWGTFWGQFWVEIIGGLVCAIIFLFLVLIFFRPKIKIAGFLCKIYNESEDKEYYHFKFVNSSFFDAHEIKAELYEIRKIPMGNGLYNNSHKRLELLNADIAYLPRKPMPWITKEGHPHCMTVRSSDDISTIIKNENSAILIRISLKHGLTGLTNVFQQDYANTSDVKRAKFKPGPRFAHI